MKNDTVKQTAQLSKKHKRKLMWRRVVSILAAITVFCTTYALILPAITLTADGKDLDGGYTIVKDNAGLTGGTVSKEQVNLKIEAENGTYATANGTVVIGGIFNKKSNQTADYTPPANGIKVSGTDNVTYNSKADGTFYADFGNDNDRADSYIEFTANDLFAGDYTLTVNVNTANTRYIHVSVDETYQQTIKCTQTGLWDGDFGTFPTVLNIPNAGNHTIRLYNGKNPVHGTPEGYVYDNDDKMLPSIDYVTLVNTTDTALKIEAEDGKLGGGKPDDSAVNNGAYVGNIGNDGNEGDRYVEYTVYANDAGTYPLDLCYATNNARSFYVTVNGAAEGTTVACASTSGWINFSTNTIATAMVPLVEGKNVIRIGGVPTAANPNNFNSAPNLDYIKLRYPKGAIAEPSANTYTLTVEAEDSNVGGAKVTGDNAKYASGEAYIGDLGRTENGQESYLEFTVYVPEGSEGECTLSVTGATWENRTAQINVDGQKAGDITLNSGAWDFKTNDGAVKTIDLDLIAGTHTIRICSPTGDGKQNMPNIDKIDITSTNGEIYNMKYLRDSAVLRFDFDEADFKDTDGNLTVSGTGKAPIGDIIPVASAAGVEYYVDSEGYTVARFDGDSAIQWKTNQDLRDDKGETVTSNNSADPLALTTNGVSTISMWIKPDEEVDYEFFAYGGETVEGKYNSAVNVVTRFTDTDAAVYYRAGENAGDGNKFKAGNVFTAGEWNLVTLVQTDADSAILYVNGKQAGTIDGIQNNHRLMDFINNTGNSYYLGNSPTANKKLVGDIDDFAVWDRALSADEIAGLYKYTLHHQIKVDKEIVDVPGATVKLFNYDKTVNDLKIANNYKNDDGTEDQTKKDQHGFRFFHAGSADDVEDGKGLETNTLGSWFSLWNRNWNTSTPGELDNVSVSETGYPQLNYYWDPSAAASTCVSLGTALGLDDEQRTLRPYFDETYDTYTETVTAKPATAKAENQYYVATMQNGGGLFKSVDGYYEYDSAKNAAWYDADANKFELYDHVVRPRYIDDAATTNEVPNERYGNFLPFNKILKDDADANDAQNYVTCDLVESPDSAYRYQAADAANNIAANDVERAQLTGQTDLWFGMMIEFDFYMPKNGQVNGEDMIFDFHGDDDVYVMIDDVLVLNIGGIHAARSGYINFATGEVTMYTENDETRANTTLKELFVGAGKTTTALNGNTFSAYTSHKLKFFYMERGGNISYCRLRFNMPPLPNNSLTVQKELELTDTVRAKLIATDTVDYKFRVVQAEKDEQTGKFTIVRQANNSGITEKDKDGNQLDPAVTFIDAGTTYTDLQGATAVGTGTVGEHGVFTLRTGQSAQFESLLDTAQKNGVGYFVVQELIPKAYAEQYDVKERSGANSKGVPIDPSGTVIIDGVEYNVYSGVAGLYADLRSDETNADDLVIFSSVDNVVKEPLSKLRITKEMADGTSDADAAAAKDKLFQMNVTLGGKPLPKKGDNAPTYNVYKGDMLVSENKNVQYTDDGKSYIEIKPGQTAELDGILAGTIFSVMEVADDYNKTYSATAIQHPDKDSGKADENIEDYALQAYAQYAAGTIPRNSTVTVKVVNAKYDFAANIPISKQVLGGSGTANFEFEVEQVADQTGTAQQDPKSFPGITITTTNEKTAKGNIVLGFKELDFTAGNTYYFKVSEKSGTGDYIYDETFYVVAVRVQSENGENTAAITGVWKNGTGNSIGANSTLAFVNQQLTTVYVHKTVVGKNTSGMFNFSVACTDKDEKTAKFVPDNHYNVNTNQFSIAHNGVFSFKVPVGSNVTVTETNPDGYYVTYAIDNATSIDARVSGYTATVQNVKTPTNVYFFNAQGYELPQTGGIGTHAYTIGGLSLLSAAGWLLYRKLRRSQDGNPCC